MKKKKKLKKKNYKKMDLKISLLNSIFAVIHYYLKNEFFS